MKSQPVVPCNLCDSTGQRIVVLDAGSTDGVPNMPDTCAVVDCFACRPARERAKQESNR